ncbi:hypothetical protein [Corynebacterium lipophiloflavum]|uniref:hypothetical protein n=1 Tax=Corynebacterium lipophiloflavum TaxID=161889 RepID=UPI00058B0A6D|nr:hypothetical protein [Corynebacterium lipophiloflavum]
MQLTPTTPIRLAPGVRVFVRGRNVLQFGLDATRCGVIDTALAELIQPVLARLRAPTPLSDVLDALNQTGMAPEAARNLIDELAAYRIVVAEEPRTVLLVGSSPLADALSMLLRASGITVRTPLADEPLSRGLASADPTTPAAFVDQLPNARDIARLVRHRSGATLPVSTVDARVFIGPLGVGRAGPCLYCAHLYHAQRDEQWEHLVAALDATPARPDAVTIAAGASAAAMVLRRLAGVPDPPGVSAKAPARGEMFVSDPYGPVPLVRSVHGPHPRCPVCY